MRSAVRAALLSALCGISASACGGGGGSPPPSPPPSGGTSAPPTFTSSASVSVQENAAGVVYRATASDPENATLTYSLSGGADSARFSFNSQTQELRFAAQPDFESPADANRDNVYEVQLSVSDGANTVNQLVRVTVTDVGAAYRVRRIASGLSAPIFVAGLPDGSGRIVVIERAGRIRVLDPATGAFAANDFLNLVGQIDTNGEKGLVAIAFSPNFLIDRTFYIHMSPNTSNTTEIRQYRTLSTSFAQADTTTANGILTVQQPSTTNHKGGFLGFDKTGRLLIGLGDGGGGGDPDGNGQNPNALLGKILRIDPANDAFPGDPARDYAIPAANPFATSGGAPEVLAMGLRNPFRASVDPVTGDIMIGDVGQDAIEEVDRLPANPSGITNYGWARREGSQPYNGGADSAAFTLPVTEYAHGSGPQQGNSLTGGVVYRGPIDSLQGQYLFADFVSNNLWSAPFGSLNVGSVLPSSAYTRRNTDFTPDTGTINSVVAFGTDTAFNVYIVDLGGEVFKLEPAP